MFVCHKRGKGVWDSEQSVVTDSIFAGTLHIALVAFAIMGLVNDSIVAVDPIFWLLCGVGCRLTVMNITNDNQNK